jgi:mono/diheme cytochrome c family protein
MGRGPAGARERLGRDLRHLGTTLLVLATTASATAATSPGGAGDAERGERLYARTCAACHGAGGKGDGPGAAELDPLPRDFTQGQFRFRTTATGQTPAPGDVERTIRNGLPGTTMPAFGETLSAREIADLTAHVMSFAPASRDAGAASPEVAVPAVPPASDASIAEGRSLYRIMECWACHGLDGSGRGTSAEGLVNEVGRPIAPTDFRYAPLKGGHAPEDVVRSLLTGLNGTPMPSYGDAMLFAREDVADLSTDEGRLPKPVIDEMRAFITTCPGKDDLAAMDEEKKRALRDWRLAALAHYVVSLRRRGLWSWLFRESPENEARP